MSRKVFPILFILIFIISSTGCLYGNIVDNKYQTNCVGNLTPCKTNTYYLGYPPYLWANGYFTNFTTNTLNLFNTNTQISRNGAGDMIFTDAISGTKTLAQLTVGSGGNVSGSGSLNRMTYWDSASTIGDSSMYFDVPNNRYGIGTVNPELMLHLHDGGGPNGIQLSYTIGALYSNITSSIFGYLQLMPSGGRVGINDLTPSTALDVTGSIRATQDVDADVDINAGNDLNAFNGLGVTNDADIGGDLRVVGAGRFGNTLNMTTHQIINVVDPILAQDAATKNYVDTRFTGGVNGTYYFYSGSVVGNVANITVSNGIITHVGVYP